MEFTGQFQRKLTEFENAIGKKIPPNMKGFIIKRQSRLTSDYEKLFHLHNMSRLLPADQMIKALCRLDQTPALVSDVIRERGQQGSNPKDFSKTFQQSNYPDGDIGDKRVQLLPTGC